jgi:predicted PurR-regulated permease PerM
MQIQTPHNDEKDERHESQVFHDNLRRVYLDPSSPSIRSIARVVIVTMLIVFVANRIENIIGALTFLLFFVVLSIFFAYLIEPLVRLVRKPFELRGIERFLPRGVAIAIAYLIVFTVLGLAVWLFAPVVTEQAKEFGANLPTLGASIQRTAHDVSRRFERLRLPEDVQERLNQQALSFGEIITTSVGNSVLSAATYLPWLIIIPILSFFFLKDANSFRIGVLRVFPAGRWRARAESVLQDVNATLAAYSRAQLISCVLIGTVCTIGFYLIGLKYALLLGILAGIFEFVPLIGPLVIAIVAITTAGFSDDPWKALYVGLFLLVLRITHDYVTYPRIVRGGLHLHPLAVVLSVLAGEQVAGIAGVFLAIPLVAIGTVVYRHVLEHQGSRGLFAGIIESEEKSIEEEA